MEDGTPPDKPSPQSAGGRLLNQKARLTKWRCRAKTSTELPEGKRRYGDNKRKVLKVAALSSIFRVSTIQPNGRMPADRRESR